MKQKGDSSEEEIKVRLSSKVDISDRNYRYNYPFCRFVFAFGSIPKSLPFYMYHICMLRRRPIDPAGGGWQIWSG